MANVQNTNYISQQGELRMRLDALTKPNIKKPMGKGNGTVRELRTELDIHGEQEFEGRVMLNSTYAERFFAMVHNKGLHNGVLVRFIVEERIKTKEFRDVIDKYNSTPHRELIKLICEGKIVGYSKTPSGRVQCANILIYRKESVTTYAIMKKWNKVQCLWTWVEDYIDAEEAKEKERIPDNVNPQKITTRWEFDDSGQPIEKEVNAWPNDTPLPSAWYHAIIENITHTPNSSGGKMVVFEFAIEGRIVRAFLSYHNPSNESAQSIARDKLNDIMNAVGPVKGNVLKGLIGKKLEIRLGPSNSEEYPLCNDIIQYKALPTNGEPS